MRITIVDENDNIIGSKDQNEILVSDIYRVYSLWISNSKDEVLLARRAFTKSHDPGKWGPAVAGTVEQGETYESNIYKEAREELGLENLVFEKGPKKLSQSKWNYFVQQYFLKIDKPADEFKIQKEEVVEVRWFAKEQLKKLVSENPDDFLSGIKRFVESV